MYRFENTSLHIFSKKTIIIPMFYRAADFLFHQTMINQWKGSNGREPKPAV